MATKIKSDPARAGAIEATGDSRLARATAALSTAESKLADRERGLAESVERATKAKARIEELRPDAADQLPGAIESLRAARTAALEADDDVATARAGVDRALGSVALAHAELTAAQQEETARRFEASRAERIAAAGYVDRALAGTVEAVRNYVETVRASQQLYQDITGRLEARFADRVEGVIATALHDFVSLPFPHAGYRRALAVIEAELLGLGEPDAKRIEEQRQADEAEARRVADPARIQRERLLEIERLKHFVMRSAGSKAPECIEARRRLAELTSTAAPDDFDAVRVSDVYE